MNSWDVNTAEEIEARRKATEAFCRFFNDPTYDELRAQLISESAQSEDGGSLTAKALFAKLGDFYLEGQVPDEDAHLKPIPSKTVFRVFDEHPFSERDWMVNIVLPKYPMQTTAPFEATEHYRCTYWPYLDKKKALKSRSSKKKRSK